MFIDLILTILIILIIVICVLIRVAFFTLFERKILGYIQLRRGPNKVGYYGILQPFSDAIKLFTKEQVFPTVSNFLVYYISPLFSLIIPLVTWLLIPYKTGYFIFELGVLFILCCLRVGVYSVIIAGWSSNRNYSLLGGLRAIAQTISYEVRLSLFLLLFIFFVERFNLVDFYLYQNKVWFLYLFRGVILIWLVISLAETHRSPFDFAEGERELVSGFNVEYRRGGFALLFLGEYARIIFISFLFVLFFLGDLYYYILFFFKMGLLIYFFIWVRGTLPRYRYDKLINLAWKSYLPISLNLIFFYLGLKYLIL